MATRMMPEGAQEGDYVHFGDVARDQCNMQCQYASRYLAGELDGYPKLGEDLRWFGNTHDYHGLEIHKDDVSLFVARVLEHRARTRG